MLVVAAVVLLLLLVHDAPLHVFLELLDVLAQFDGRLVDQAADDGVDLAVPRSALRQRGRRRATLRLVCRRWRQLERLAHEARVEINGRLVWLILLHDILDQRLPANVRDLSMLLLQLSDLLPLDRIAGLHTRWLAGEDVLYREDLVEELELLET